ncbi:exodeoxyribonuclease V subunit beta [Pelagicoccus mobilis]|uniref:DNA 3'-5' helicase n=1 Tax=Pelagicoccus mobilis TaxID=415221 RepID=A0A934RVC8_9BACT|nr:exodeoxyribonuclease V subunit beta [Pelagicoccus mobilis]MBK1875834.1 exodeoxyribonuclease V subunit beta [Pelagicoccus mobilis]
MIELAKGATLIEASAGTGKTYTLCRIALQLTLEKGITLDRILAVTFTDAATEELASRIHELYQQALRELETEQIEESLLLECMELEDFDIERAKRDLRFSLEVFDEAPISTLHGFCKRSLDQLALETESPLEAELNQIETHLVEQLQQEYIRQYVLEASSALSIALKHQKGFEGRLSEIGKQSASHPEAKLHPTAHPVSFETLERRFLELPEALSDFVSRKGEYIEHLKANREPAMQLSGKKQDLFACEARGKLLANDFAWLEKFSVDAWKNGLKKSGSHLKTPPFVSLVDAILEQIDAAFLSLLYNYKGWLSENLEKAKQQANSISFNDLLHILNRALKGESGERVRANLSRQYDAALIDEFQDTDRTQLQIAKALFGEGEHYLFYIGDPKQAIYRFRGADIYAYFQATESGKLKRIELTKNYRSTPPLIHAVNTVFEESETGFVDDRIRFTPVEAGLESDTADVRAPALFIEHLMLGPQQEAAEGRYRNILTERVANDFANRISNDPDFRPEEVAFLVNSNFEAKTLSDALLKRGIASAIRSDRSVFDSKEARDLTLLLAALSSPTRTSLKRGAYAAFSPSLQASDIAEAHFDENATPFFEYIVEWNKSWERSNFDVNLQTLLKLASRETFNDLDSERRHANISQLSELLSEAKDESDLTPRGLYNWICRKMVEDASQNKDWQTRISSDEGKPQILTIHKSKGLQFPIVILPYLSLKRVKHDAKVASYHGSDNELIIDFAPDENQDRTKSAQSEELAEHVRLLYVALTRAEKEMRIYLAPEEIVRRGKKPPSSFSRFILGVDSKPSSELLVERLKAIAAKSKGNVLSRQSPLETGEFSELSNCVGDPNIPEVEARSLQHRQHMPYPARVLSFSALNKGMHHESAGYSIEELEAADSDSDEAEPSPDPSETDSAEELSIFSLPKGTHAGDLLHLILERFDFSRPETLPATTQAAFELLKFEPSEFEPIVAAQIAVIAKQELASNFSAFSLEQTPSENRIPELEFAYPVSGDVKREVIDTLQTSDLGVIPQEWSNSLNKEGSALTAAMLRGFIDLVLEHEGRIYIFDWKSNYLGPTSSDYDQSAILESMSDHNYFLQYLLYCVAVLRFTRWRFPNQAFDDVFGGVFYIYARGVSPGKDTGVFYDRPSIELLEKLDTALGGPIHD